jgi:RimJ/RimL family protein N-acetyltransferase
MSSHQRIETGRLCIRLIDEKDGTVIQMAAAAREIADTMISIPHPYPDGEAQRFIARRLQEMASGRAACFVVENKDSRAFLGLAEIREIEKEHMQGELSFWLIPGAWGYGYMSEILPEILDFGFECLGLNRIYAHHMVRNPSSGKVLKKSGFKQEGYLRQRVRKWGQFEDVLLWAIIRQDWLHHEGMKDL